MRALPPGKSILVAIDASPHSLAALEMAAKVAALLHAELHAMYVEDIDLLRAAQLPFVRVIGTSGQAHPFTPDLIEQQLRRRAEIARNAVKTAGTRANVTASFSVVRGTVSREIARAAGEAEVVTVGRTGWSASAGSGLGSVARALLEGGTTSVLMVEKSDTHQPITLIYDGSPSAERALNLAIALDGTRENALTVILTTQAAESRPGLAGRLSQAGTAARFELLENKPEVILESLQRSNARTVLIPATIFVKEMQGLNRSVFVVR
jgi:nucleotide-binding universal stress UspA family protein